MEIVTDMEELDNAIELFWQNLESASLSQKENDLGDNITVSIKINNGEFYCYSIANTKGAKGNGPLRHHIFIKYVYHEELTNLMEIGIPLEYHGRLPFGRVSRENEKYYLLRAVNGFYHRSVPENFSQIIKEKLKDDIIKINGRDWIRVCSISDFNQSDFVRIIRAIKACKINFCADDEFLIEDIEDINRNENLTDTEKKLLTKARIGQGNFRAQIINYWNGVCAVTGCDEIGILIASHIKPWRESDNNERLDKYNGLLLSPNIDRLFDNGFITFNDKGEISISKFLCEENRKRLGVTDKMSVKLNSKQKKYMKYHRENIFRS
ncbi:MAG: HNH endonuclease [Syntrophaceae bacterium]|nr:HNH endonuclease [Syntrophaceae bacterium]